MAWDRDGYQKLVTRGKIVSWQQAVNKFGQGQTREVISLVSKKLLREREDLEHEPLLTQEEPIKDVVEKTKEKDEELYI